MELSICLLFFLMTLVTWICTQLCASGGGGGGVAITDKFEAVKCYFRRF